MHKNRVGFGFAATGEALLFCLENGHENYIAVETLSALKQNVRKKNNWNDLQLHGRSKETAL